MLLDWTSKDVEVFLNTKGKRLLEKEAKLRALPGFEGHIWLATSGSRREKFVALSKRGILESARAVNQHFKITHHDIWLNALPPFHIGGLSIWARAYLSSSGVIIYPDVTKQRWDPARYYDVLKKTGATLTSLVPTQVYDLVEKGFRAPNNLRAVLVGGGHLTLNLFQRAAALGWPLAPTYSLTECSSQVASAHPGQTTLQLLPHVEVSIDSMSRLRLKSPALFSAYAYDLEDHLVLEDPKAGGWYDTNDLVSIHENALEYLGRSDDMVKIGGESVLTTLLDRKLQELMHQAKIKEGLMVTAVKDDRLGMVIEVMAEKNLNPKLVETLVSQYNNDVMPYERLRHINWVDSIPRTILGKMVKRSS